MYKRHSYEAEKHLLPVEKGLDQQEGVWGEQPRMTHCSRRSPESESIDSELSTCMPEANIISKIE